MYDPSAPDSPHLSGAQPTWGDLPYACEILHAHWKAEPESKEAVSGQLASKGKRNKVSDLMTLLGPDKLVLLSEDKSPTPQGVWIARNFDAAAQQGLDGEAGLGAKQTLSSTEQALFGQLLFERDWIPMLATVNVLVTTPLASTETDARANEFKERLNHLDGYQNLQSINSWKKKAQAHIEWAKHLDLAYENTHGKIESTGFCQQIHQSVRTDYHPDWP